MCGTPTTQPPVGGPGAAGGGALSCEVCRRPYKTQRGLDAHLASVHPDHTATPDGAAGGPWAAPLPEPDGLSAGHGPWATPTAPPAAPPGGLLPPPPPPPPAPPSAYPSPPAGPLPAFAPPPDPAGDWVYAAADPTTTMPAVSPPPGDLASPGEPEAPQAAPQLYQRIAGLGRAMRGLYSLLVIALILTCAANSFMFIAADPDHRWFDLAVKVDERMFLALPILGAIAVAIGVVSLVWLYRAVANQVALGAERLRLRAGEALALAFVPVVNLFTTKMALSDVWRTADARAVPGDRWRSHTAPGRLNLIWVAPLLNAAVSVGIALVVENRLERDGIIGVSTLDEAKFLYAGRGISLLVALILVNSLRKIFQDITDRQELAFRQIRDGGPRNFQRYTGTNQGSPYAARTA